MYHIMLMVPSKRLQDPVVAQPIDRDAFNTALAQGIPEAFPLLHFQVRKKVPPLDCIPIAFFHNGFLVSRRFYLFLQEENVAGKGYEVQLSSLHDGSPFPGPFFLYLVEQRNITAILDEERSHFWVDEKIGQRVLSEVVMNQDTEAAAPLLFTCYEGSLLFIHEILCKKIQKQRFRGVAFVPLFVSAKPLFGLELQRLQRNIQKNQEDAEPWYEMGTIYHQLYHYEQSLAAIEHALSLNPHFVQAWYLKGFVLLDLHRKEEAMQAFIHGIQVKPEEAVWYNYCELLREFGRNEEALKLAEARVKERKWQQVRPSWYQLGKCYQAVGRWKEALQAFDTARSLPGSPYDDELYLEQGDTLCQLGLMEEAFAIYEEGLRVMPVNSVLWEKKTAVLQTLGRDRESQEAQKKTEQLVLARTMSMQALVF